ncbi:MAG: bifunctional adenosylcobinamide kinase/adenosylcobinamide-phosphate guanylyltransferase [Prochlorococcaceae cyanobacterium]
MVVADSSGPLPGLVLICGPSRGGKSEWAEHLLTCLPSGTPVTYLATGGLHPDDADWQERLRRHRQRRPAHWGLREVGGSLAASLAPGQGLDGQAVLIDALGSWVAAHLDLDGPAWRDELDHLLLSIDSRRHTMTLLVAEEVGWGVVPPTRIGGCFRDRCGEAVGLLAERACEHWLVVAGRALPLHRLAMAVPRSCF